MARMECTTLGRVAMAVQNNARIKLHDPRRVTVTGTYTSDTASRKRMRVASWKVEANLRATMINPLPQSATGRMRELLFFALLVSLAAAWRPTSLSSRTGPSLQLAADAWKGEIVSNDAGGQIMGCLIEPVTVDEDSIPTEWTVKVDGVQADLGRFSEAVYRKIMQDAKQQRFQGFRPGTIPPHLEVTYRAFAMDECARETVLEAMQQQNIRPFENARAGMVLENFSVPPPKKKKSKKRRKTAEEAVEDPSWQSFDTMKEAIQAGRWVPGNSFSFEAREVRGQKVMGSSEAAGAKPLGLDY